jgi:hypothetical protein
MFGRWGSRTPEFLYLNAMIEIWFLLDHTPNSLNIQGKTREERAP